MVTPSAILKVVERSLGTRARKRRQQSASIVQPGNDEMKKLKEKISTSASYKPQEFTSAKSKRHSSDGSRNFERGFLGGVLFLLKRVFKPLASIAM